MRVLVACEYSGIVRDAFAAKGHDAWSCDLLPTEKPGNHYQGDVMDIINNGWDLMIAHPPCQYLTYAGIGYFNIDKYGDKARARYKKREKAWQFFLRLWRAPIERICIENPRGYPMQFIKPSQMIHPFYFGDPHKKLTCLWLKGLPRLNGKYEVALNIKKHEPEPQAVTIRKPSKNFKGGEIKKRYFENSTRSGHERSRFWPGIAKAMAQQWG